MQCRKAEKPSTRGSTRRILNLSGGASRGFFGPLLAPLVQLLLAVPIAAFGLREFLAVELPHRQQNVGVVVPLVAALVRRMDRDIRHHPLPHELLADKSLISHSRCCWLSSCGKAANSLRAGCPFFCRSAASARFQSSCRSRVQSGAPVGAKIPENRISPRRL